MHSVTDACVCLCVICQSSNKDVRSLCVCDCVCVQTQSRKSSRHIELVQDNLIKCTRLASLQCTTGQKKKTPYDADTPRMLQTTVDVEILKCKYTQMLCEYTHRCACACALWRVLLIERARVYTDTYAKTTTTTTTTAGGSFSSWLPSSSWSSSRCWREPQDARPRRHRRTDAGLTHCAKLRVRAISVARARTTQLNATHRTQPAKYHASRCTPRTHTAHTHTHACEDAFVWIVRETLSNAGHTIHMWMITRMWRKTARTNQT